MLRLLGTVGFLMSKRSNRTRGNRPVNMGRSLRARQMTVRKGSRGTRGSVVLDEMFTDNPDIREDALLFTEAGILIGTESDIWMAAE